MSNSDRLKDDSLINIAAAELQRSYIGDPLPNQYKSKQETTKGPALGRLELALFDKDSDDTNGPPMSLLPPTISERPDQIKGIKSSARASSKPLSECSEGLLKWRCSQWRKIQDFKLE